jgi:hypothetical protein
MASRVVLAPLLLQAIRHRGGNRSRSSQSIAVYVKNRTVRQGIALGLTTQSDHGSDIYSGSPSIEKLRFDTTLTSLRDILGPTQRISMEANIARNPWRTGRTDRTKSCSRNFDPPFSSYNTVMNGNTSLC